MDEMSVNSDEILVGFKFIFTPRCVTLLARIRQLAQDCDREKTELSVDHLNRKPSAIILQSADSIRTDLDRQFIETCTAIFRSEYSPEARCTES